MHIQLNEPGIWCEQSVKIILSYIASSLMQELMCFAFLYQYNIS